jgi:hypothetical protein
MFPLLRSIPRKAPLPPLSPVTLSPCHSIITHSPSSPIPAATSPKICNHRSSPPLALDSDATIVIDGYPLDEVSPFSHNLAVTTSPGIFNHPPLALDSDTTTDGYPPGDNPFWASTPPRNFSPSINSDVTIDDIFGINSSPLDFTVELPDDWEQRFGRIFSINTT